MQQRGWMMALVVVPAILAGCAGTPAPSAHASSPALAATSHFEDADIAFDNPVEWDEGVFQVVSSFSSVLVYLSTSPLADPCVRAAGSITCGAPVDGLAPRGVLVEWSRQSFPGWTFDPTAGRLTTVGGRRAAIADEAPTQGCEGIQGEREVVVTIDDAVPDQNWTEMRACLRGPGFDDQMRGIGEMLDSVAWRR